MKSKIVCAACILCAVASVSAQAPSRFNYQGRLLNGTNLFNGLATVSFGLYDAASGGVELYWEQDQASVVDGLYSTVVGNGPGVGSIIDALNHAEVWLEVTVAGQVLTPRERMASVAYSLVTRGWLVNNNLTAPVIVGNPDHNTAETNGWGSFIGGGTGNTTFGPCTTVGGGYQNNAAESSTTVGGGNNNQATADFATVPGGWNNHASGTNSFAAGRRAKAVHEGSFVWGDNTDQDIYSILKNHVLFRCQNGVQFQNAGGNLAVSWAPGATDWVIVSDRSAKTNIHPADVRAIAEKVARLPVSEWSYIGHEDKKHLGPMAQDFYEAFRFNENDKAIDSGDLLGVTLAAVQGLYQENQELKKRVDVLEQSLQALKPISQENR